MARRFTDRELSLLKERLGEMEGGSGETLPCPSCGSPLELRRVSPRSDVSYVRERVWLLCGSCGRTAVVDQPRPS